MTLFQSKDGLLRRTLLASGLAAATAGVSAVQAKENKAMYGLIGQMIATPGKRDELVGYLLEGSNKMPGCFSYTVALDTKNADAIWITEVWDSPESHKASLQLSSVKAAIGKARPIIAGFGSHTETTPIGGIGLPKG
jgi:quinol monooxygenase YgiN